jgi:hypothetical protein
MILQEAKMRAVRVAGTLVLVLFVLGVAAQAQDRPNGNLAERQKAPTVLGGTGLFNTFSTRTLCKGEFNFAAFWNNFDRDPGDLDINQLPFNFTIGLTNRWELWVDWITFQQTTSRNPFLISGYQLSAVRPFGDPFTLLGPPVGGGGGAAFFPGPNPANGGVAPFGGILPTLGYFGTPTNFPNSLNSPSGRPDGPPAVGLGPAIFTDRPSFYNEAPFFGEVDFFGFDQLGRAVFGPRQSSNGSGDFYVGTKFNLIDPNTNWFSMAIGGYVKIPISHEDHARARGRTTGEYEVGPILMFGQESPAHRFRFYQNIGYIHTGDIEKRGVEVLNLRDKLLLNAGLSIALHSHVEFVAELPWTVYVGSGTANLNPNNPLDLNLGLRFFFKDGAVSFGGAYRRFINHGGDRGQSVLRFAGFVPAPFRPVVPSFDFPTVVFPERGNPNGFVAYISVGPRKECPVPPAPTCVSEAAPSTVNRGERLTLTAKPTTPGYADGTVTYEYRWDVKDAQGRPVTVSGSGASVEVPTSQLPCGSYSAAVTVTASVPAADCPSGCVTTGQTSCTSTFNITEPPCPSVSCSVTATPASVMAGERVTLRANASGEGNLSYSWSASAGSLSSTSGSEVTLDTTGTMGTINVTLNVSTDRTRCNEPCPGSSCSTSVTVGTSTPETKHVQTPCGPIFFPVNAARINNEHKACLDEIALRLQGDPRSSVVVDGHRDSSERVGISLTRANNARDYLVNEKGVDAARITVRNFGDTCPHPSGDPALNRRVEFWLVPDGALMDELSTVKQCAAGASPQVITTESPAPSVDRRTTRRPRRRR